MPPHRPGLPSGECRTSRRTALPCCRRLFCRPASSAGRITWCRSRQRCCQSKSQRDLGTWHQWAFSAQESSASTRSEEHTSELQSLRHLVCRLLLEEKISRPPRLGDVRSEEHTSELQSLRHLL